jgi:hypothetical protein
MLEQFGLLACKPIFDLFYLESCAHWLTKWSIFCGIQCSLVQACPSSSFHFVYHLFISWKKTINTIYDLRKIYCFVIHMITFFLVKFYQWIYLLYILYLLSDLFCLLRNTSRTMFIHIMPTHILVQQQHQDRLLNSEMMQGNKLSLIHIRHVFKNCPILSKYGTK